MADFDNITGWQEELAAFDATEEGRSYFNTYERTPGGEHLMPKTPPDIRLSTIFDLAEQYFKHAELREAVEYWVEWSDAEAANINLQFDDPQYFQSLQKYTPQISHFRDWYAMKKKCPFNIYGLDLAVSIAAEIVSKNLPKVNSPGTIEWVRKQNRRNIVYDI